MAMFPPRFNTENGMWRAAIFHNYNVEAAMNWRFNTENGMWRAAIRSHLFRHKRICDVSIPRTVCGGLQCSSERLRTGKKGEFQYRERYVEGCNLWEFEKEHPDIDVSIPRTVCGGLQYCAPEPLGLLAPDE